MAKFVGLVLSIVLSKSLGAVRASPASCNNSAKGTLMLQTDTRVSARGMIHLNSSRAPPVRQCWSASRADQKCKSLKNEDWKAISVPRIGSCGDCISDEQQWVCVTKCPSGWRETTINIPPYGDCWKPAEYGNGAGYTTRKRCKRSSNGRDLGCKRCGLLFYPKCRNGFKQTTCNFCKPKCPKHLGRSSVAACRKRSDSFRTPSGDLPMQC